MTLADMDLAKQFLVKADAKFDLSAIPTRFTPDGVDKLSARARVAANKVKLFELQTRLYASSTEAVLVCFQGMDAAGKDGAINALAGGLNPIGCETHAFKAPSSEERAHDFLWRIHKAVPPRGKVGLFNRTHYEAVLVERVKKLVPEAVWRKRYDQIREFEQLLVQSGTKVVKFFLHIGKDEQLERFKDRLDDPLKQWKISESDYSDRVLWDDYQQAYAEAIAKTSTEIAPWYVIPADRKWVRDLAVTEIVCSVMEAMKIPDPKPAVDLAAMRVAYHQAGGKE